MIKLPVLKVRETSIEKHFCKQISLLGGTAYKFTSPGNRSVPDRLVVLPGLMPMFVEVKAPGGRLTPAQLREHIKLRKLNQLVYDIDSKEEADALISFFKKYMARV